jgi:hypothetical protein
MCLSVQTCRLTGDTENAVTYTHRPKQRISIANLTGRGKYLHLHPVCLLPLDSRRIRTASLEETTIEYDLQRVIAEK